MSPIEYGYAEAKNIPRVLYFSSHRAAHRSKESAIISDLAGKKRNLYTTENKLFALLQDFSKRHPYTKRFEKVLRQEFQRLSKGPKKRMRALALKVIHQLDNQSDIRREDLVQALLADPVGYKQSEIGDMIRRLHKYDILYVEPGRYSRVSIA